VSFPVTAGQHTFRWTYLKDSSGSSGSDTAWIDSICLPEGDIIACASGNSEDFETGNLSAYSWRTGGSAQWSVVTSAANHGAYSAKAGSIGSSQTTYLETTFNASTAGTIAFASKVSSEANYDKLNFYIDGTLQNSWSGTLNWSRKSYAVTAGQHIFRWTYSKDSSGASGSDTAWLDDICLPQGNVVTTSTSSSSTSTSSSSSSSTSTTTSIICTSSNSDTFETGGLGAYPWTTGGNAPWSVDNGTGVSGAHAVRAGAITDSQSTDLQIAVDSAAAGTVSFYYKVSSESGCDELRFYMDGTLKNTWSGAVTWAQIGYPVTAGQHTFRWSYSKDGSVSQGSDTAWLDDICLPEGSVLAATSSTTSTITTTTTTAGSSTTTTTNGSASTTTTAGAGTSTTSIMPTTTTTIDGISPPCPAKKVLGEDKPKLENLRDFRDSTLAQSAMGRKVIQIYYNNADSITAALERSPVLRAITRRVLETIAPVLGKEE
jgi:hypothetical protein